MPRQPSTSSSHASAANADELGLVRAAHAGEPGALATLLTRYQDRLFNVCLRMVGDRDVAADLTQDAFVKIIQGLPSFDGRSTLSTWLVRVAMNVCLSYLRAQRLRRHASLDAPASPPSASRSGPESAPGAFQAATTPSGLSAPSRELLPAESVEIKDQHARVAAALAVLPPEQRSIIVLRDVQGLDYEQIASVLDLAVGTVKSRLFRARLALRQTLEGTSHDSGARPSTD